MADVDTSIYSPVPEGMYPLLATSLLSIGLMVAAYFFIYLVTTAKISRSIIREIFTGAIASFFLGFGSLFLLLWTGVYV